MIIYTAVPPVLWRMTENRNVKTQSKRVSVFELILMYPPNSIYNDQINSYNRSQRDALFLKFILVKKLYMFRTDPLSIIRSLNTVYTKIGIFHASMINTYCCVYSVETPNDRQWICPKHAEIFTKINLRNK